MNVPTPVIINADDFGLTDGICRAINELLDGGAVSATSFMAAASGATRRARRWDMDRHADAVGVHLHLTSGVPLSPAGQVPSLVDSATGTFRGGEHLAAVRPGEARDEWRRQIESTSDLLGRAPTHLDSHLGVGRLPHLLETFLDLATEYGLPVRGGEAAFDARRRERDVPGPDYLIRGWTGRSLGVAALKQALLGATTEGAVGVVAHPGYVDAELTAISSMTDGRESDRQSLDELRREAWLHDNGFELVSFTALNPRAR